MSVDVNHPEIGPLTDRVRKLFVRVVEDKRPLARMEMPADVMTKFGFTDKAWGIPVTAGPCLAVYGFNMDRPVLSTDDLIRYEEEPA